MDTKIEHLSVKNRSYRRYVQYESIPISTLKYFVEYSGKIPSNVNRLSQINNSVFYYGGISLCGEKDCVAKNDRVSLEQRVL